MAGAGGSALMRAAQEQRIKQRVAAAVQHPHTIPLQYGAPS